MIGVIKRLVVNISNKVTNDDVSIIINVCGKGRTMNHYSWIVELRERLIAAISTHLCFICCTIGQITINNNRKNM